ncbi:MAG: rhomboid family intramembrane serine protease [Candidatus Aenigmarchaeota archaeon]|nr:rhomboid family intramembrane serine protease [Candidatus Aenigmarchaeota archaeon]
MKWTLLLMLANISAFVLTAQNLDYYVLNYGFSTGALLAGKYYVIITSMFLHGSIMHLAGNMFALLVLGSAVEDKTKAWQFFLAYFLTGMFGCLSMLVPLFGYGPESIAIGASAAISGLVGLGIFVCPGKFVWFPEIVPLPFSLAGAIYFLANVSSVFAPGNIAYSAHICGFLAGAAFGMTWGENRMRNLAIFLGLLAFMIALPSIIPVLWAMLSA